MIDSLLVCYIPDEFDDSSYAFDDEMESCDSQTGFSLIEKCSSYSIHQVKNLNSINEAIKLFEYEADDYQRDLLFIKSDKANALELLFDAQKPQYDNDETIKYESTLPHNFESDSKYIDALHDNSEDLLKLLKKDWIPNGNI